MDPFRLVQTPLPQYNQPYFNGHSFRTGGDGRDNHWTRGNEP